MRSRRQSRSSQKTQERRLSLSPLHLLLVGHLFVFTVLTTQLGFPSLLSRKLSLMPIERDLQWLWKVGNPDHVEVRLAYERLSSLHPLPTNFFQLTKTEQHRALNEWRKWWAESNWQLTTGGLNGLVFVTTLLSIFALAGLVYHSDQTWRLTFLAYSLLSLCFFVLFAQYASTVLAYFYAFAFMMTTFTLGYLAQPELQPRKRRRGGRSSASTSQEGSSAQGRRRTAPKPAAG